MSQLLMAFVSGYNEVCKQLDRWQSSKWDHDYLFTIANLDYTSDRKIQAKSQIKAPLSVFSNFSRILYCFAKEP